MWDHTDWMDFRSRVQQKGVEMSEDMQSKLGDLLEAMKEYHSAVSSTDDVEKAMSTVFNESVAFIKRQKGVWGHAEWEDFWTSMSSQVVDGSRLGADPGSSNSGSAAERKADDRRNVEHE